MYIVNWLCFQKALKLHENLEKLWRREYPLLEVRFHLPDAAAAMPVFDDGGTA